MTAPSAHLWVQFSLFQANHAVNRQREHNALRLALQPAAIANRLHDRQLALRAGQDHHGFLFLLQAEAPLAQRFLRADAAAVLRALNRWRDYPLSVYALCELGAQIGSDVPFCVLCGTALAEGRGERLTKLPDTPEMFTVICKPDVCFSTPALYAKLDEVALAKRPDTRAMRAALEKGDLEAIGAGLCNVFEQVAIPDHLELNYIKSIMMSYGAYGAQMTGSGSAVYGLFDSFEYAAVACTMLKDNYPQVFIAKTV